MSGNATDDSLRAWLSRRVELWQQIELRQQAQPGLEVFRGQADVLVRGDAPNGKADSVEDILERGGRIHTHTEVTAARFVGERIELTLNTGSTLLCSLVIVQIGFLSAKDTFQRLDLTLNDDGSIAIDPYFESSRRGIFAVGDVHGDIKLIAVAWAAFSSSFITRKFAAPLKSGSPGVVLPVAVTSSYTIWSYGLLRANKSRKYFCIPSRLMSERRSSPPLRPIRMFVQIVVQFRA